ncbi:hypothetical protein U3516DRAFT_809296 [Neocallimastix sp. 'constans']
MVKNYKELALRDRNKFIENGADAGFFEWLGSKGTNYSCYEEYLKGRTEQQMINVDISNIRTIVYALQCPFTFKYFYWTLLVFILHKFNFKKPVMKLILCHYIFRTLGDICNQLGGLYNNYYSTQIHYPKGLPPTYECKNNAMHPFKWFISRQVSTVLWYVGEIFGDWYPLLRTKAVVKNNKLIWFVYGTCGIFNFSKILLIILHVLHSPTKLYNDRGAYDDDNSTHFYSLYYINQFSIIIASVIYDISVYFVLKRTIFKNNKFELGFLKKFKNLSEYRILISSLFSIIFLPIISVVIIIKYYVLNDDNYRALDFNFETTRIMITGVQYYMIFIDQILLICYKDQSSYINSNSSSNILNYSNGILNKSQEIKCQSSIESSDTLKYNDYHNYYSNPNNNIFLNSKINNINNENGNINSSYYYEMLNLEKQA